MLIEKKHKLEFHKKVVDTTYYMANSVLVYMTQNKPTGYCSSERYTTLLSLLIVVNNIFARRGSRENKLPDIRKTITDKLNMSRWNDNSNRTYFLKFQD